MMREDNEEIGNTKYRPSDDPDCIPDDPTRDKPPDDPSDERNDMQEK